MKPPALRTGQAALVGPKILRYALSIKGGGAMVEPISALLVFAGGWLAKKMAKDWAEDKKQTQVAGYQSDANQYQAAKAELELSYASMRGAMGRLGIARIESLRRVLPQAVSAAERCRRSNRNSTPFDPKQGWFGGRDRKALLLMSAGMVAVDLRLPEGEGGGAAAEAILSTIAAQGAFGAFAEMPHHEGVSKFQPLGDADLNKSLLDGVDTLENWLGQAQNALDQWKRVHPKELPGSMVNAGDLSAMDSGVPDLGGLDAFGGIGDLADAFGDSVVQVMAEIGGAMDSFGDLLGEVAAPLGWLLTGFSVAGALDAADKISAQRTKVQGSTQSVRQTHAKVQTISYNADKLRTAGDEATYQLFKASWVARETHRKRWWRSAARKERDRQRAVNLEQAARRYWTVVSAPLLAPKGGVAAPLPHGI